MSIRGVRQLKGLKLRYCDLGGSFQHVSTYFMFIIIMLIKLENFAHTHTHLKGSSRGARSFIQQELVQWAANNPAVEVNR